MPLTIFYGNLEDCADSFLHFSSELGDNQYEPPDAPNVAKNHLFTQYHAQYPSMSKSVSWSSLLTANVNIVYFLSPLLLVLALTVPIFEG